MIIIVKKVLTEESESTGKQKEAGKIVPLIFVNTKTLVPMG